MKPYQDMLLTAMKPQQDMMASLSVMDDVLSKHYAALSSVSQQLQPFAIESATAAQLFGGIDWDEVIARQERAFVFVAECGWTVPDWIALPELGGLCNKSPVEIETYFVDGFMRDEACNLRELGESLQEIADFARWHPLIRESIDSIAQGRHRVAIPALLSIMDGYISEQLVRAEVAPANITSPFKVLRNKKWHENDDYDAMFWKSGMIFLGLVFANSDFAKQPPSFINRH